MSRDFIKAKIARIQFRILALLAIPPTTPQEQSAHNLLQGVINELNEIAAQI